MHASQMDFWLSAREGELKGCIPDERSIVGKLPSAPEQVDWGSSLSLPRPEPEHRAARIAPSAELGNLSALEDDKHTSALGSTKGGKPSALTVALAAVAALAVGLGFAYFAGILPH